MGRHANLCSPLWSIWALFAVTACDADRGLNQGTASSLTLADVDLGIQPVGTPVVVEFEIWNHTNSAKHFEIASTCDCIVFPEGARYLATPGRSIVRGSLTHHRERRLAVPVDLLTETGDSVRATVSSQGVDGLRILQESLYVTASAEGRAVTFEADFAESADSPASWNAPSWVQIDTPTVATEGQGRRYSFTAQVFASADETLRTGIVELISQRGHRRAVPVTVEYNESPHLEVRSGGSQWGRVILIDPTPSGRSARCTFDLPVGLEDVTLRCTGVEPGRATLEVVQGTRRALEIRPNTDLNPDLLEVQLVMNTGAKEVLLSVFRAVWI